MRTEQVELTVDGQKMPTFVAYPEAAGPRPAVLVFQEIFGVNPHVKDVATRLAREGYVAIAPDYHHRAWAHGTTLPYNDEGMKQGMEVIPKLTFDGIEKDIDACLAYLKTKKEADTHKLGAMGFCIGGH
ncbi:MAG TPA: dienelactone hydrolase family protein, partial [Polyangia bacterium]